MFSSHRGRLYRNLAFVLLAVIVIMGFFNMMAGSSSGGTDPETTASPDETVEMGSARVYEMPTEAPTGASAEASEEGSESTSEDASVVEAQEKEITDGMKGAASDFAESWVTYDYENPGELADIENAEVSEAAPGNIHDAFDDRNKSMKDKEALSSGEVKSTRITKLDYQGDADSGVGKGTVTVVLDQTVTDKDSGSAGSTNEETFVLKMERSGSYDSASGDWVVVDVQKQD